MAARKHNKGHMGMLYLLTVSVMESKAVSRSSNTEIGANFHDSKWVFPLWD